MNNIYYTNFMYAVSKDIGAYTDDIKFVYEFQDRFLAIVKISTNECVIKTFMKEIGDNKGYFLDVNLFNGSYESCLARAPVLSSEERQKFLTEVAEETGYDSNSEEG